MPISSITLNYGSSIHETSYIEPSQHSPIPMRQYGRYCALQKALKLVNATHRKSERRRGKVQKGGDSWDRSDREIATDRQALLCKCMYACVCVSACTCVTGVSSFILISVLGICRLCSACQVPRAWMSAPASCVTAKQWQQNCFRQRTQALVAQEPPKHYGYA